MPRKERHVVPYYFAKERCGHRRVLGESAAERTAGSAQENWEREVSLRSEFESSVVWRIEYYGPD